MEEVGPQKESKKTQDSDLSLEPSQRLETEQLIAERYRVISLIGQGGMGCVYLVEQIFLHKEFALKTLNPGNLSPMNWRRFQKEAQATSALDHPNLIRVHDFGMLEGGQPFFVMDYFEGETLANKLERGGAISLKEALPIFIQSALALAHAHSLGVIHRDMKPSNIMIAQCQDGGFDVRVVDFGIAKLLNIGNEDSLALTRTGEIFGTPYYMSPEQCLGASVDHRADIYSLGCLMFQVLSGMPPYIGDSALAIMMQHQSERPPNLKEASLGKTFPDAIDRVIRKMVEKNPSARYQSLLEVVSDLELIQTGQEIVLPERVENKTTQTKTAFGLIAMVTTIVVCVAAGFFIGRLSAPEKKVFQSTPASKAPISEIKLPTAATYSGAYFSTSDSLQTRLFHFPESTEQTLGVLHFPPGVQCFEAGTLIDQHQVIQASGDLQVKNFQPFELEISEYLCQNPRLFARFRSDELSTLSIRDGHILGFSDNTWRYCSNLKMLTTINLPDTRTITNASIEFFDRLPKLSILRVDNTEITGTGLAEMHQLKKLRVLHAEGLKRPEAILKALEGSTAITNLALRVSDLSVQSMCTLPNLRNVNLCFSQALSDVGLRQLTCLKNLRKLTLYDCPQITLQSLKSFSNLSELVVVVRPDHCFASLENQRQLRKALPKTKISFVGEKG